jgi:hypothetical protein
MEFLGEGGEKWVSAQLHKILEKAPTVQKIPARSDLDTPVEEHGEGDTKHSGNHVTLARFLQEKKAGSNQVKRFLATAEWLTARGNGKVRTGDVTKALKDSHQGRLSNPADCLNKNVAKGYCEKDGKQFFVTPEGRTSLG